jgi:peptidoglycan/xylan/chitin deacetylase (PgdA/CDA1 family)
MKSVMYHYVRPFNRDFPFLKNLSLDNFKKQLDFFAKEFGFIRKDDFVKSFTGKITNGVILTFDDGFSCHYDFVFKELKKRGLWGVFYIPTHPFIKSTMIDVHRIHVLLSKHNPKKIYNFLIDVLDDSVIEKDKIKEFRNKTYILQKNDNYTNFIKRSLNYYISYQFRNKIISLLMEKFVPNENEIFKKFYLTKNQILEMHNSGMVIGSHTVNHPVMSRLNVQDQESEIKDSFQFLEGIIKKLDHKTFCHPYGGFHSFTYQTEKILSKENCLYSFNVEPRDIDVNDLRYRPQALPRYDCNQFPFGQVDQIK